MSGPEEMDAELAAALALSMQMSEQENAAQAPPSDAHEGKKSETQQTLAAGDHGGDVEGDDLREKLRGASNNVLALVKELCGMVCVLTHMYVPCCCCSGGEEDGCVCGCGVGTPDSTLQ